MQHLKIKYLNLAVFILLVALWQISYVAWPRSYSVMPSPFQIFEAFKDNLASVAFYKDIGYSLFRVAGGFAISLGIGLLISLITYFSRAGSFIAAFFDFFRSISPIAWTPLAILFFGSGEGAALFIVFLGGVFPVFTSCYDSLKTFPEMYRNLCGTFDIKGLRFIRKVLLPYLYPALFTGCKTGLGMSWMCLMAAEMISAQNGLGAFIQINRLLLRTDHIIVGMLVIGLIGYLLMKSIDLIRVKTIRWNYA